MEGKICRKRKSGEFRCSNDRDKEELVDENEQHHHQTLILPHHLVLEHILPKLPVKSLIRFKSVCKNWYSFISTPEFANSHLQFSSSHYSFLFRGFRDVFFLLSYNKHGFKEFVELDRQLLPSDEAVLLGSCNGLVCLYFVRLQYTRYSNGFFAIWNPSTHQFRKISNPSGKLCGPCFFGFGYASIVDDYKIVAAYLNGDRRCNVYVFSLRAGEWRQICGLDGCVDGERPGLFVNDTLYWDCPQRPYEAHLFGLNLVTEQFIELPKLNCGCEYWFYEHMKKGCLALYCEGRREVLEFWILKQDGGDSYSWEKLFSVPRGPGIFFRCFSMTGKCLIQERFRQLKLVDLGGAAVEHTQGTSIEYPNKIIPLPRHHIESLISPFGWTTFDKEEGHDLNK